MRIPTKFKLLGRTINVVYSSTLINDDGLLGQAKYDDGLILLQSDEKGMPISQDLLEENFLHELIHHIFRIAGDSKFDPPLNKREFLIQRVAGLLHQAFTTAEYEKKGKKKNA